MSSINLKCPKCSNLCEFGESRLFGFCNKCGSNLERTIGGVVSVYDKAAETDEFVLSSWERYDICTAMKVPSRADHDFESFDICIETMMDELMSFTETQKDVIAGTASFPDDQKIRIFQLCLDMTDRLLRQFEAFLKEYSDYGMYDEFVSVQSVYGKDLQSLTSRMVADQNRRVEEYWAQKPEEYKALKEQLRDAKNQRGKVAFFDFQKKWELDALIMELESKINMLD